MCCDYFACDFFGSVNFKLWVLVLKSCIQLNILLVRKNLDSMFALFWNCYRRPEVFYLFLFAKKVKGIRTLKMDKCECIEKLFLL